MLSGARSRDFLSWRRRELGGGWGEADGGRREAQDGWLCPKSWRWLISWSEHHCQHSPRDKISRCLTVIVFTIEAWVSAGQVDNWMVGRADIRLRLSSGIYYSLPTDWGGMCVHSGLIVMMAMVMMAMMMVLVMVITVAEVPRQVSRLRQHQHQSCHRLRAF